MKRVFAAIMALLAIGNLSAQEWRWGVEAGVNLTQFQMGKDGMAEQVGNMKPGFQAGVTVDYEFKRHWMLMSGLSFLSTHSHVQLNPGWGSMTFCDTEVKRNHLMLPLKVGYDIRLGNNFQLIPAVGLYVMAHFNAGKSSLTYRSGYDRQSTTTWKPMDGFTTRLPLYEEGSDVPTGEEVTASIQAFRRWTCGLNAEIKAVWKDHYTLSFSYLNGLTKAQSQNGLRDYGLALSIGYRF